MTNNEDIVLDEKSGISVEEQREILAEINGVAEKNKLSLSQGAVAGKKQPFKAMKNGGRFPVLVNVAALILLAGGFFLLSSFQGRTEAQVREGTRIYTSAERALIDEIRRETASKLALKEREMAHVLSQLEGVGEELRALYSSKEELTAEQRATEERLLVLHREYSLNYSALQDERSQILEDSRASEAILRAMLESRTRELASNREELSSAREELLRLSGEMEKAAAIEAQLEGGFASVHGLISSGRLSEAGEAIKNLRTFLDTPSFRNIRSIQARREFYSQAITSFEVLLDEANRSAAAGFVPSTGDTEKELADLQLKNTRLEETVAGLNTTIVTLNSGSSGQAQLLTELNATISALRTQNTDLQTSVTGKETEITALQRLFDDRDRTVRTLEAERTSLNQTIRTRDNTITEMQSERNSLNNTLNARNNTISIIQDVVQGKPPIEMNIGELMESVTRIQNALQSNQ